MIRGDGRSKYENVTADRRGNNMLKYQFGSILVDHAF